MHAIGIDLGGTKLAAGLFGDDGTLVRREVAPLVGREGEAVGGLIADHVRLLLDEAAKPDRSAGAIGVSIPGIFRSGSGTVWAPNIPGWDDYPLQAELEALVSRDVRVRIDSDRACSILGEAWQGVARGCQHAVFLAVGTGIGAGVLVDGRVLRGSRDIAGAIGWLALDRPYRPEYETFGCFEYHASGLGLARVARDLLARDVTQPSVLREKQPQDLAGKDIFSAYDVDDAIAIETVEVAIAFWGMAVANLVSLFDPEMIVFGGGVFGPASRFLDRIRAEATRWAQPISMPQVELAVSELGGDAALYGAARLAME